MRETLLYDLIHLSLKIPLGYRIYESGIKQVVKESMVGLIVCPREFLKGICLAPVQTANPREMKVFVLYTATIRNQIILSVRGNAKY